MAFSLQRIGAVHAPSVISTRDDDRKWQSRDIRSMAAVQLEFELGYVIEDYIANGKERFTRYIEQHLQLCSEYITSDSAKHGNTHKMKEIKVQYNVWKLLAYLSKSRNTTTTTSDPSSSSSSSQYYFNPSKFIRDRFNADYELRKLEYILLWLQEIAPSTPYLEKGDISHSRTSAQPSDVRNPLLRSLDPDVINRMSVNLSTLSKEEMADIHDEERVLYIVFRLIRKGSWNDAIELCRQYGLHWRAASMNGRTLFSDAESTTDALDAVIGNEEYLMWLRCCNAVCRNSKLLPEKWIYAALCGNIDELLTYATLEENDGNWYDLLWVLLVCKQVHCQHQLLCDELPSFYHNTLKQQTLDADDAQNVNVKNVFSELKTLDSRWQHQLREFTDLFAFIERKYPFLMHKNSSDTKNADVGGGGVDDDFLQCAYNDQYYRICKFVICGQYDALLNDCWQFVNDRKLNTYKHGVSLDFMRFVIHLYLHLNPNIAQRRDAHTHGHNGSGGGHGHALSDTFVAFIKRYIEKLIACEYYETITRYCYILPKPQLVSTLTQFLMSLKDTALRIELITKSKSVLPPQIISKISGNIAQCIIDQSIEFWKDDTQWMQAEAVSEVEADDHHKIDSLMCLKIVNDNYSEMLHRTNQLFMIFAKQYKCSAIQQLFLKMHQMIELNKNIGSRNDQHFNTYLCFKRYKFVIDAYATWKTNHYLDAHLMPASEKHKSNAMLKQYVRALLSFGDGFLNPRYCAIQPLMFSEINQLRHVILKRLLSALYTFVCDAHEYAFCVELMTIFAHEKYAYYKLFEQDKEGIKELLRRSKDAKIEIIKQQQQQLLLQKNKHTTRNTMIW